MKSAALPYAAYFYDFLSASMLDAQRAIPAGADAMRRGGETLWLGIRCFWF